MSTRLLFPLLMAGALLGLPAAASADEAAPRPVRTPRPIDVPPGPPLRTPQPVYRAPAGATRVPTPVLRPRAAPAPAAAVAAGPVYNVVVPVMNGAANQELLLRLGEGAAAGRLELRLLTPGGAPAAPAGTPATPVTPATRPVPTPAPLPAPYLPAGPIPVVRELAAGVAGAFAAESYAAGGIETSGGPLPALGLAGRYDLDDRWWVAGGLDALRYSIEDRQIPGSRHDRDDVEGQVTAGTFWGLGPTARAGAGLGYWGRFVAVESSLAPALTTPLVSSPSQLFHGPRLAASGELFPQPGLRLALQADAVPYVFTAGDQAVIGLEPLLAYGATAGASWQVTPGVALSASYGYHVLSGTGFSRALHGPRLGVAGSF